MKSFSKQDLEALRNSGLFDEKWYLEQYPDVKLLGMDPIEHYLWVGEKIGRKPSSWYEAIDFGLCSVRLKSQYGPIDEKVRRLATSHLLDAKYVCKQLGIPLCDRLEAGHLYYNGLEKRQIKPNPLFDPAYYRHANGLPHDIDPVWHYLNEGAAKHLPCHRLFDGEWYKSQLPEALSSPDLLAHYWQTGYRQQILPVNPQRVAVTPRIKKIFFLEMSQLKDDFDPLIYRGHYNDLSGMSDVELSKHYDDIGIIEGRLGSLAGIFKGGGVSPHFVPLDFTPTGYADVHLDLAELFGENGFWNYLSHYLIHGLTEGRAYNLADLFGYSPVCEYNYSTKSLSYLGESTTLCVLMHLYYPDMWDELNSYLRNIDISYDLYINLVDSTWTPEILAKIRMDQPRARVSISQNTGRDIGGFVRLLDTIDFDRYVAFATIHSKKSPHVTKHYASHWRSNLIDAIVGSKEAVEQNVAAFLEDKTVGIIGSARYRNTQIGDNADIFEKFLDMYGVDPANRECEYVSGTMMMVRSDIMRAVYLPLKEFDFQNGDDKGLDHHMDGQAEHAVERIFGNVMRQLGYRFLWR